MISMKRNFGVSFISYMYFIDCLCASQHIFFPIYLAVYLYECQLVKLSVCLRNCLSMCLYLCMSDHIGQTIIISAQSNHITKDA